MSKILIIALVAILGVGVVSSFTSRPNSSQNGEPNSTSEQVSYKCDPAGTIKQPISESEAQKLIDEPPVDGSVDQKPAFLNIFGPVLAEAKTSSSGGSKGGSAPKPSAPKVTVPKTKTPASLETTAPKYPKNDKITDPIANKNLNNSKTNSASYSQPNMGSGFAPNFRSNFYGGGFGGQSFSWFGLARDAYIMHSLWNLNNKVDGIAQDKASGQYYHVTNPSCK